MGHERPTSFIANASASISRIDQGASVTNDADAVIAWLAANLEGGIGKRKVYYRDTDGRFDELKVNAGAFAGFAPCSEGQQTTLAGMLGQ